MGSKRYIGWRKPDGTAVVEVQEPDGSFHALPHAIVHSPTGFEWGYLGAGPSDLALAILLDVLGESARLPQRVFRRWDTRNVDIVEKTRSWALHDAFKREVIGRMERDAFVLPESSVRDWLARRREAVTA